MSRLIIVPTQTKKNPDTYCHTEKAYGFNNEIFKDFFVVLKQDEKKKNFQNVNCQYKRARWIVKKYIDSSEKEVIDMRNLKSLKCIINIE